VRRFKRALIEARAAVILYMDDASEQTKSTRRGDPRARRPGSLGAVVGLPASTSPAVKKVAADAITAIERNLAYWNLAQNTCTGFRSAPVLLLAAIGLAITFA